MLLKLDYRPLIRIQLELLYINKIRTLERIMLCEFQMDCDDADRVLCGCGQLSDGSRLDRPAFPGALDPADRVSTAWGRPGPACRVESPFPVPRSQGAGVVSGFQRPAAAHPSTVTL